MFAKLFERNGDQIVLMKQGETDEGNEFSIELHFHIPDIAFAAIKLGFSDESVRDNAFDAMDYDHCWKMADDAIEKTKSAFEERD